MRIHFNRSTRAAALSSSSSSRVYYLNQKANQDNNFNNNLTSEAKATSSISSSSSSSFHCLQTPVSTILAAPTSSMFSHRQKNNNNLNSSTSSSGMNLIMDGFNNHRNSNNKKDTKPHHHQQQNPEEKFSLIDNILTLGNSINSFPSSSHQSSPTTTQRKAMKTNSAVNPALPLPGSRAKREKQGTKSSSLSSKRNKIHLTPRDRAIEASSQYHNPLGYFKINFPEPKSFDKMTGRKKPSISFSDKNSAPPSSKQQQRMVLSASSSNAEKIGEQQQHQQQQQQEVDEYGFSPVFMKRGFQKEKQQILQKQQQTVAVSSPPSSFSSVASSSAADDFADEFEEQEQEIQVAVVLEKEVKNQPQKPNTHHNHHHHYLKEKAPLCTRCGRPNHTEEKCNARTVVTDDFCHFCGRPGHWISQCTNYKNALKYTMRELVASGEWRQYSVDDALLCDVKVDPAAPSSSGCGSENSITVAEKKSSSSSSSSLSVDEQQRRTNAENEIFFTNPIQVLENNNNSKEHETPSTTAESRIPLNPDLLFAAKMRVVKTILSTGKFILNGKNLIHNNSGTYVIQSSDSPNCYRYVGTSTNCFRRIREHFTGINGAKFTKELKHLRRVKPLPLCSQDKVPLTQRYSDESRQTLMQMRVFGLDNVRGGPFCKKDDHTNGDYYRIGQMFLYEDQLTRIQLRFSPRETNKFKTSHFTPFAAKNSSSFKQQQQGQEQLVAAHAKEYFVKPLIQGRERYFKSLENHQFWGGFLDFCEHRKHNNNNNNKKKSGLQPSQHRNLFNIK